MDPTNPRWESRETRRQRSATIWKAIVAAAGASALTAVIVASCLDRDQARLDAEEPPVVVTTAAGAPSPTVTTTATAAETATAIPAATEAPTPAPTSTTQTTGATVIINTTTNVAPAAPQPPTTTSTSTTQIYTPAPAPVLTSSTAPGATATPSDDAVDPAVQAAQVNTPDKSSFYTDGADSGVAVPFGKTVLDIPSW